LLKKLLQEEGQKLTLSRLLKNAHLRRSPRPSSLQRTSKYASLLRISGALHLDIFDQPYKSCFFSKLLVNKEGTHDIPE